MDPRELEALAKRLGENANDTEALNAAYAHGQQDPRAYAVFLERAGTGSVDPASGAHWFCEAATVWTTSLSDPQRAERALVRAVDKDPLHPGAAERLIEIYRHKNDVKGVATLHARRAKGVEKLLSERPELKAQLAEIYSELARIFVEELNQPDRAIEAYKRAASHNPEDAYSIYQARELLKAAGRLKEALPYFFAEQALIQSDPERRAVLYADEIEVCRQVGDPDRLIAALRGARSVDSEDDAHLKQQLASAILDMIQAGAKRPQEDLDEAVQLFVELAEAYNGEHGHAYAVCALGIEPAHDRAAQLAMFYGEQIGKERETAGVAASYLSANPTGAVSEEARSLIAAQLADGAGDELIGALIPSDDEPNESKARAYGVIAQAMANQGRATEAHSYYSKVIEFAPADVVAVTFLADTLRGKQPAALCELLNSAARDESAAIEQRHAWYVEVAEVCETTLADVDGAIEARRQLVLMNPADDEAAEYLESILEKSQKWRELAELVSRRAELDSDYESRITRGLRVVALYRDKLRDPLAAATHLSQVALLEPENEERVVEAVELYLSANEAARAAAFLKSVLAEMLGDDIRSRYNQKLGGLLEDAGELAEAGAAFSDAAMGLGNVELWGRARICFAAVEAWQQAAEATAQERALTSDEFTKSQLAASEAGYLYQLGDPEGAVGCLQQALDHNPRDGKIADQLQAVYEEQDRHGELVTLLLMRADVVDAPAERASMRKRAAFLQRDELNDLEGMRHALLATLEDGEDADCLLVLADDTEAQGHLTETIDYLRRLSIIIGNDGSAQVTLRLARLLEEEGDEVGALEQFQLALDVEPDNVQIISAVAPLQRSTGDEAASADSYEQLLSLTEGEQKLAVARCLAELQSSLGRTKDAIGTLKIVLSLDEQDLEAIENIRDLSLEGEFWEDFVVVQAQLIEFEGDEDEGAKMALKLAEVYSEHLQKSEAALEVLIPFAQSGSSSCLEEYERLGDRLGKEDEVAESLVGWMRDAPGGPKRNQVLGRAYERFLKTGNRPRAIFVGLELVRMKGAKEELAKSLEETAVLERNLEALQAAFLVLGRDVSGPSRADEMVRQAEVLAAAGLAAEDAVLHGEQALTSIDPNEVERLLARLSVVAGPGLTAVAVYERQVTRCKSSEDRISALARAAEVASTQEEETRVTQLLEVALQVAGQGQGLDELRVRMRKSDEAIGKTTLRKSLCSVLSEGGKTARDGGRSRSAYLARAAAVAFEDLDDVERAFQLLKDSLASHVDEEVLDQLLSMGEKKKALSRAAKVIGEALEVVRDGPLVRLLLRRRLALRTDQLNDPVGAGEDLKRLYELSPTDGEVSKRLEDLYQTSSDHRSLVQLYEDQILRGRDQVVRGVLARKVAHLWQDTLEVPREAADAWRRVLRMSPGDEEAREGLAQAKQGMRKISAQQIALAEEENRRDVENQRKLDAEDADKHHEELQAKGEVLKARHSFEKAGGLEAEVEEDSTPPEAAAAETSNDVAQVDEPVVAQEANGDDPVSGSDEDKELDAAETQRPAASLQADNETVVKVDEPSATISEASDAAGSHVKPLENDGTSSPTDLNASEDSAKTDKGSSVESVEAAEPTPEEANSTANSTPIDDLQPTLNQTPTETDDKAAPLDSSSVERNEEVVAKPKDESEESEESADVRQQHQSAPPPLPKRAQTNGGASDGTASPDESADDQETRPLPGVAKVSIPPPPTVSGKTASPMKVGAPPPPPSGAKSALPPPPPPPPPGAKTGRRPPPPPAATRPPPPPPLGSSAQAKLTPPPPPGRRPPPPVKKK